MKADIASILVGLTSVGLGIIALLDPSLRLAALIMIASFLGLSFLYLQLLKYLNALHEHSRAVNALEKKNECV